MASAGVGAAAAAVVAGAVAATMARRAKRAPPRTTPLMTTARHRRLDNADQPDFTYPAEAIKPVAEDGERGRRRGRRGGRRRRGANGEMLADDACRRTEGNSGESMEQEERAYGGGFGGGFGMRARTLSGSAAGLYRRQRGRNGDSRSHQTSRPMRIAEPNPAIKPVAVKDYGKVTEATEAPKGGWWKKLVQ